MIMAFENSNANFYCGTVGTVTLEVGEGVSAFVVDSLVGKGVKVGLGTACKLGNTDAGVGTGVKVGVGVVSRVGGSKTGAGVGVKVAAGVAVVDGVEVKVGSVIGTDE